MKIILASETYPPDVNGAAVFTNRLGVGLAKRGHDIHNLSPSPSGASYLEEVDGVTLHRLPSFRYPWHPTFHIAHLRKARHGVGQAIREISPDVVHLQGHFVICKSAAHHSRLLEIPLVATNHFMPENIVGQIPFALPQWALRQASAAAWRDVGHAFAGADRVTTPTPYAAELLRGRVGIEGATPISCGVDTAIFSSKARMRERRTPPTILFVGRLDAEKHVDVLIKALQHITPLARLRIVGEGSCKTSLRSLARRLAVEDRITFTGYLDNDALVDEYVRADIFCMPGTAELQSIATLEAMAAGLPIVAALSSALPHLVKSGINGELFTPGNDQELGSALAHILADSDLRWRFGLASREHAELHDLEGTLDAYEEIYFDVIRRREEKAIPTAR